jgi:hypothetical protein
MPVTEKLKDARDIVKHLEGERQRTEDQDAKIISEYLLPHRGFWPSDGDDKTTILQRGKKNINPAATLSLERAAGGLTVGMTPEGLPWFELRTPDKKLMEAPGVREHLSDRTEKIGAILREGGFYQSIYEFNIELLGFPGTLLYGDSSQEKIVRFESCTFGTYAIALDDEGNLDTVVRRIKRSAKQLKKKYGEDKLSQSTKELLKTAPYTLVDIIHLVRPREDREHGKIDSKNMKYQSIIYEESSANDGADVKDILSESGYHEMPYFFGVYSRCGGSEYGMSPGHLLIGHTKQLNETERQKLIALQKIIAPPMKKPANFKGRLDVGPNAENAVSSADPKGVSPLYEVPVQGYQYALQEIQDVMQRIAAVAKADLFYDLPAEMRPKDMTATEYMERKRERMQQIAPVVSIYEPYVLDKVIERVHNVLDRMGAFGEPPPVLVEAGAIKIEYVSTVAKALRQVGAEATRSLLLDVKGLAEIQVMGGGRATVLHKIDFAQAVDEIASGVGAPARIVRDDAAYEELIDAENKALAEQSQKQEQLAAMDSAAKLGNVRNDGIIGEALKQA